MTKNTIKIFSLFTVLIMVIGILLFNIFNTNLDLQSDDVKELYSYLGNDSITKCSGELFYITNYSSYTSAEEDILICNAYLYASDAGESVSFDVTSDNVCEIDDLTILSSDGLTCLATKYDIATIKDAYYNIYNEELTEYVSFDLFNLTTCVYSEANDAYYCYNSNESSNSTVEYSSVYRLIKTAVKHIDGSITIKEYFINITDDYCNTDLTDNNPNFLCFSAYEEFTQTDEIDTDFMKTYAAVYVHTFEEDDGNYYWVSSEKIS